MHQHIVKEPHLELLIANLRDLGEEASLLLLVLLSLAAERDHSFRDQETMGLDQALHTHTHTHTRERVLE